MACQFHCAYEDKCPVRLSDALNFLAGPEGQEHGPPPTPTPLVLELLLHLLMALESQRASCHALCVVIVPKEFTRGTIPGL